MKKRTREEIKEVVETLGYIYIDDYTLNNQRKVVIRDYIGYKYDVQLANVFRQGKFNFADIRNPFSLENISLWLKIKNSQFRLHGNDKYKGADSKLNLYCDRCKDYPTMNWGKIYAGRGCGICHGKQIGIYHNLEIQHPDIAKEWHPTKNGSLTPKDVTHGSNKKVWWLCPNGHEYYSMINDRTSGKGCGMCSNEQQESKVASELKNYIVKKYDSEEEYRIIKNPDTGKWLWYDIYIFEGKDLKINGIYIEIHGLQHYSFVPLWHKTKEKFEHNKKLDKLKKKFAKKNGTYIEVDLRKIKTTEQAIKYVEKILKG